MFEIVPLSNWFSGKDLIIDIFSVLVLSYLLYHIIKYYKIKRGDTKYRYLITSFALLTISFIFKVLAHFIIYYPTTETRHFGVLTIVQQEMEASGFLVFWGIIGYRVLSLLALYFLTLVYVNRPGKLSIMLTSYLLILVGYFSYSMFHVYHVTCFLLMLVITWAVLKNYLSDRYHKTKLLLWSFTIILISHGLFFFLSLSPVFYIIAEIVQLIGYLLLLITFIQVLRSDGKKTRKN